MSRNWKQKRSVTAAALIEAADILEREARDLRERAKAEAAQYAADRARLDLPHAIKHYIERLGLGDEHDLALKRAGDEFGVGVHLLKHAILENERAMRAYHLWKRNRRILALAHRYSNQELAEKFDLSPGRISQIIGVAVGRTSPSGHLEKRFLIPDAALLPHERSNQKALKRRRAGD